MSGPAQASDAPSALRVRRGTGALDDLRTIWGSIHPPWASPMMSPAWLHAWAEVYGTERDLEFWAAGEGSRLVLAPLVRSRHGGLRYDLAGPDNLTESMDFLYEDSASISALTAPLVRSRIPLRFWRVPADSPAVPALVDAYRGHGLVRLQPGAGCPSVPLDASWANPEAHLDAKGRQNLRRARRIAEGMGTVATEILAPSPEEVPRLLDEAYAVEAAGWKSREGSPLVRAPLLGDFFRRYAAAAADAGELRVCFLRIGGRAAAMKLAAVTGGRFWLLTMGFAEEFERCSPGTLLLADTLAYAARSGLRSYEFLGAMEPWVRAWGAADRPHVSLRTYPFGLRGFRALGSDAADRARTRLRNLRRWVSQTELEVERKLALAYSAGPAPEDAARMADTLTGLGYPSIIGYMNEDDEDPRAVARNTVQAIQLVAAQGRDCYAAIKAPALQFNRYLIREIVEAAKAARFRVHFDALSAGDVDRTFEMIQEMQAFYGDFGTTLPSRWKRSTEDVERAVELGLSVRVIRGEWVAPRDQEREWRQGFLEIVDRLAGRVPRVAVATHNPPVAREAVRRLKAAKTPVEVEVVRGYPIHRVLPVAVEEGVPVRVYIPFGKLASPYTIGQVLRRPRIVLWVTRDIFRGGTSVIPRDPRTPPARKPPPVGAGPL